MKLARESLTLKLLIFMRKHEKLRGILLLGPSLLLLSAFFLLPLASIVIYSTQGEGFIANYSHIFQVPIYRETFVRTLKMALEITVMCLIIGYPTAYYLGKITRVKKETVMTIIMLPFFVTFIVRCYAWIYILGVKGLVNFLLLNLGLLRHPLDLLFSEFAVVLGLVNYCLPFMILPIYVNVEKIDRNLIDAAKNLGANNLSAFVNVTLPLSVPGITAGCLMSFILSVGSFITPAILGGPGDAMIAMSIQWLFIRLLNWPLGSAAAIILFLCILAILYTYHKLMGLENLTEAFG